MADFDDVDDFDDRLDGLLDTVGAASAVTQQFSAELARASSTMNGTAREVGQLSRGISRGLKRAIDGLILDGDSLTDAVSGIARSLVNTAYSIATRPVTNRIGEVLAGGVNSLFGGLFQFADGGSFAQGRVTPFASGGVVSGPTAFPMRGGVGLMGEAGPEAIMPLARGSDGRLGVRADTAAQPVSVVMNITTPDAQSFQRSQSQIAAQMGRVIGRGLRNR